jgi:fructokinase
MIVSCGEALIDFIPASFRPAAEDAPAEAGYIPRAGGSPCNVAVGIARLDVAAGFLGALSTDLFGDVLDGHLIANGVDRRFAPRLDRPSTLGFVSLPGAGEPRYAFFGEGAADRHLTADLLPPPEAGAWTAVEALHFGSFSLSVPPVADTLSALMAREHGRRFISLDPNIRPALVGPRPAHIERLQALIARADLVKVSEADLDWLHPGEAPAAVAARWLALGPRFVVVTLGAAGAVAFGPGRTVSVPGRPVTVVDTVGAGDSFMAGLLAELHVTGRLAPAALAAIGDDDLAHCLAFANRVAGITCGRAGANPPRRGEL